MSITKRLETEIEELADSITQRFSNEPLDGDEVDVIVNRFRAELNLRQGNIASSEYEEEYEVRNWRNWFDSEVFPEFIKKDSL